MNAHQHVQGQHNPQSQHSQPSVYQQPHVNQQQHSAGGAPPPTPTHMLDLKALAKSINPDQELSPDVLKVLEELADDMVEDMVSFSCRLATHRGSTQLDAKDVQLYLKTKWGTDIPGYNEGADPLGAMRARRRPVLKGHEQRQEAVRKSQARADKARSKEQRKRKREGGKAEAGEGVD